MALEGSNLVLARSPYFIHNQGYDENATLTLDIQEITVSSGVRVITTLKTYSLNFKKQSYIDISPLLRDYLTDRSIVRYEATVDGTSGGGSLSESGFGVASNGYGYYENGYNYSNTNFNDVNKSKYGGSTNVIYRFTDEVMTIPLISSLPQGTNETYTINFLYKGDVVYTTSTNLGYMYSEYTPPPPLEPIPVPTPTTVTSERIQYVSDGPTVGIEDRVIAAGGTLYHNPCIDKFIRNRSWRLVDEVTISTSGVVVDTITVHSLDECRYEPQKIAFVNRWGVEDELWFFKRSSERINTEKEQYRGNNFNSYLNGDLSKHTYIDFNVNGKESITVNSGFVVEEMNEAYKQLMLSERVYIYKDGVKLPINIKDSFMEYKTKDYDKLINYTFSFDFSYNTINNIH